MATYGATVRSLSPVAYWPLDEASGTVAYDQMGANPGTYVGSPTLGVAGPLAGDTATAVTLASASTQYVNVGTGNGAYPAGASARTLSAWVKTSTAATQAILGMAVSSGNPLELYVHAGGSLRVWDNVTQKTLYASSLLTGAWINVVAVYDGSAWTAYINGVGQTPVAMAVNTGAFAANGVRVGTYSGLDYFNGSLAHVAVFNRALSATEVALLYTAGTAAPSTPADIIDPASILAAITSVASGITGIRTALDYDEWPDSPAGLFKDGGAVHLTGMPGEDGTTWHYALGGPDLAIWTLRVPLYTVVNDSATANRTRAWALPYVARYPEAFRASVKLGGTVAAAVFDEDATIVRSIPGWDGWDGCYIVRHVLTVTVKGVVANVA